MSNRRQEIAARMDADFKAGKLIIENGWLVEVVDHHTCGTGPEGYYGHHEPGCGMIPVMDLIGPEIADCACGINHWEMPTDTDGTELVCRIHKRHIPCRRCERQALLDEIASLGFYDDDF